MHSGPTPDSVALNTDFLRINVAEEKDDNVQQLGVLRAETPSPSGPLVMLTGQRSGKGQIVDERRDIAEIKH